MVSIYKTCQNCGDKLKADSTWRKKFCSDNCRVQYNRAKKPTPKKNAAMKAEKYDRLLLSIKDSINRLEKAAKKAEEFSQDMARPLNERMMLVAMFREKSAIASELKLLLDMNGEKQELSYEERIHALYDVDPINYD